MSPPSPIALIFGAGKNMELASPKRSLAKGTGSPLCPDRLLQIQVIMMGLSTSKVTCQIQRALPESSKPFEKTLDTQAWLSAMRSTAAASNFTTKADPLALPLKDVIHDMNILTLSAVAVAREAVVSFKALPSDASRTFINTGNITNNQILPPMMTLGMGKSAVAHVVETAAQAYKKAGYNHCIPLCSMISHNADQGRFYYADERASNGAAVYNDIDGEAHGEFFVELSEKDRGPWLATFVKGKGYVDFSDRTYPLF